MTLGGGPVIGVDFGKTTVKVVGLTLGKKPKLIGCKEIALDPQYLGRGELTKPEVVAQAIQEAMKTAAPKSLKGAVTHATVSEAFLFRKVLELPLIADDEELSNIIRLQAAEFLPEPLDQMEVDFTPLGTSPDGITQQVMVAASPLKVLDSYCQVFKLAKLQLQTISPRASANGRALLSPKEKNAVIIIDIGSEISTISVHDLGQVHVTSTLNMGGDIVRDPATGEVDTEREEALLARLAEGLAEEVDHVLKFYANRSSSKHSVEEIRLVGGGSMIVGIDAALVKVVSLKVKFGQPLVIVPPFCDRRFISSIGAALYPAYEAN